MNDDDWRRLDDEGIAEVDRARLGDDEEGLTDDDITQMLDDLQGEPT